MTAVRFPVAANATAALNTPLGRAGLASEAALMAGGDVRFVSEAVGPSFAAREAALDAFPGRLDDERPGRTINVAPEDHYCFLREMRAAPPPSRPHKPQRPVFAEGRRWPAPATPPKTVWRLSISYWRIVSAEGAGLLETPPPVSAPRRALTNADPQALRERLDSPMTAAKPQKALDIGLFEVRPPEAPHILMPDE